MRTFVAVADTGQFQAAGDELAITQQTVSKRIATLERDLGARLFVRGPKGVRLSVDGQAFLPHARELLRVADRAVASVLPTRRALRVDVLNRRTAPRRAAADLPPTHRDRPGRRDPASPRVRRRRTGRRRRGTVDLTLRPPRSPGQRWLHGRHTACGVGYR
ncbi:MAG TPA: LysR family transcriptional regulator [Pseudonocardia sp.]|uniref:LysR family transcriptional regulator n=1 Tax=Pseudonocardia sp. TaxID=60912 RepID=UPI002F3F542B